LYIDYSPMAFKIRKAFSLVSAALPLRTIEAP
jgi:hypothetical protein